MDLLLILLPVVLVLVSQGLVNSAYKKYSLYGVKSRMTGSDVARRILDSNGLNKTKVIETEGVLTDHFDPRSNVVKLSTEIYRGDSIASVAVAAHECGHVIQHKEKYTPIRIRSVLVPIVSLTSRLGYVVLIIGLLAELFNLALIGLIMMAGALLFQLVTLPVEFNASKRAKKILLQEGIIQEDEKERVNGMLNAAAMTYLAAFFATLLQMLRFLLIITGGRRRD
jgi:Zn-dependent membrane protease YugP